MSVYITGDTHGPIDIEKLSSKHFPEGKSLTKEDVIIICGDFGLPFLDGDYDEKKTDAASRSSRNKYKRAMKWLSEKPYTILFVDGNHDNHPFWKRQPEVELYGGKVHKHIDANNVFHLIRGEIYEIQGKRFFAFGGAKSHDMWCRIENYNWWTDELVSFEDIERANKNLESVHYKVDYVISHTPPLTIAKNFFSEKDSVAIYLDSVYKKVFPYIKCWFAGHLHVDACVPKRKICLVYNTIINIENGSNEPSTKK